MVDWDLYPTEEISNLVPELVMTVHGWSLEGPMAVLVNSNLEILYQGGEFFEMTEIEAVLNQ